MAFTAETTPNVYGFIQDAANFRTSTAAYGDGKLLDAILQIIEKVIPMIMSCFPAKPMFVEAAQEPTFLQVLRVKAMALREARSVKGLKFSERQAAAEMAVDGIFGKLETMTAEEIGACYTEVK